MIDTWQDLIREWGGPVPLAKTLSLSAHAGYKMWERNFVAHRHWPTLVARSPHAGIDGITFEFLMTLKSGAAYSAGRFPRTEREELQRLNAIG